MTFASCNNEAGKTMLMPLGIGQNASTKAIENFYFTSPQAMGSINETDHTISVIVPRGADVTGLAPAINHNGKSVNPASGASQDFTGPVAYRVTAEDGSTQDYTVTVTAATGTSPSIVAFFFMNPMAMGTINETDRSIAVTVPFGTNVTALVPTIISTGASVSPASDAMQNFAGPVAYRVTAAGGANRDYTVTVFVGAVIAKEIISFGFTNPAATGVITGTNITIPVPKGTDQTALVATFKATGASVIVVQTGVEQVSGGTANDFTNPLTYRVRSAADYTTRDYTVTVGNLASLTTTAIAGDLAYTVKIAGTTARGGGIVTDQGSSAVTERGLCWNTNGSPTIGDSRASDGSGTGAYTHVSMTGLTANTVYHVRAYAVNSIGISYGNEITFNSGYAFATDHAGGYVFYNDGNGGGLVSAKSDQAAMYVWSNIQNILIGTTGTAIGTGRANTIAIINQPGHTASAAQLCVDYNDGTYNDWFLPSKDELNLMHINIGFTKGHHYWTSSELDNRNAWMQEDDGLQCSATKDFTWNVRAVRAF